MAQAVPQDFNASKTWTQDWSPELAQPKLAGVTITGKTVTCADNRVTVSNPTITDAGLSVTFKVSQSGITTATLVVIVVAVTLSNGDVDERDFPIGFTNT